MEGVHQGTTECSKITGEDIITRRSPPLITVMVRLSVGLFVAMDQL
jgi:hypothetical protein